MYSQCVLPSKHGFSGSLSTTLSRETSDVRELASLSTLYILSLCFYSQANEEEWCQLVHMQRSGNERALGNKGLWTENPKMWESHQGGPRGPLTSCVVGNMSSHQSSQGSWWQYILYRPRIQSFFVWWVQNTYSMQRMWNCPGRIQVEKIQF